MKFDDFLPYVLPSVDGCPDTLALSHVVRAARNFCTATLAWNYACAAVDSVAGAALYTLQLEPHQELVRVYQVSVDGDPYECPRGFRGRAAVRQGRTARLAIFTGPVDFTLNPVPARDGARIVADIAVKPTLDAETWPDDLGEHVVDISSGAIASLCLLPRQPWSDVQLAALHAGQFEAAMGRESRRVQRGYSQSMPRARAEFF